MPTYEYRCLRCHHQFETVHAVSESVDRCERCGGPVRRVFSPPALIFKGSGFHITDYRKTAAPSDGDGKGAAESKGETSSKGESGSKTKKSEPGSTAASSAGDSKKAS